MKRSTRYLVAAMIMIACLGCDRATKAAAAGLRGEPPVRLCAGTVTLFYTENAGAMLSVGGKLSAPFRFWVLTIGVGGLLGGLVAYLVFSRHLALSPVVALSLMVGGGASNLYDRLVNDGRVVDFVICGVGALHTGVFNLADIAITAGVILFFVSALRARARITR